MVFDAFESLISFGLSTFSFPDVYYPVTKGGSYGNGHSMRSSLLLTDYLIGTILNEQSDQIEILQGTPNEWITTQSWAINNIHTKLGVCSLAIEQTPSTTTITFSINPKNTPIKNY